MTTGLTDDLIAAERELDAARTELLDVLDALADDALDRARRGGWSVRRVLQHVIEAEWHHARIATQLRGLPPASAAEGRVPPASVPEAVRRLTGSRRALLAAVEGVDAAAFYRVGTVGHEEYSVLSLLENAANHDREHARQIRSLAAPT